MPAQPSHDPPTGSRRDGADLRALYGEDYVARFPDAPGRRLRRLAPLFDLPPAARVLDVACGKGLLLDLIRDRVGEYVGVDFSPEFIAAAELRAARQGLPKSRFVCADVATFLGGGVEPFDAAFALDVAEHVHDTDLTRLFAAVRAALRPGGALYVHTPNRDFLLERLKERGVLRQFPEHVAVRDAARTAELLAGCGFGTVEVRYLSHYHPLLRPLHALSALPGIGPWLRARLFLVARP
jgi:SAM-dependent methyltransferase